MMMRRLISVSQSRINRECWCFRSLNLLVARHGRNCHIFAFTTYCINLKSIGNMKFPLLYTNAFFRGFCGIWKLSNLYRVKLKSRAETQRHKVIFCVYKLVSAVSSVDVLFKSAINWKLLLVGFAFWPI